MPKITPNIFVVAIIASFLASLSLAITATSMLLLGDEWSRNSSFSISFAYWYFGLFANLIFGAPIFITLVKFKLVRWWVWMPLGAIAGMLVGYIFYGDIENFRQTLLLALVSAVAFRVTLGLMKGWKFGSN